MRSCRVAGDSVWWGRYKRNLQPNELSTSACNLMRGELLYVWNLRLNIRPVPHSSGSPIILLQPNTFSGRGVTASHMERRITLLVHRDGRRLRRKAVLWDTYNSSPFTTL